VALTDVHLYVDYWASVLGMRGVVNREVQRRGLVDLDIFRTCLNRPETRLPGIGYYVLMLFLGPVLIPYRMIQRIASRLHVPLAGEAEASELLSPYRLRLTREAEGGVQVAWKGERLASGLVDPERPEVLFSVVYPAYEILVAALLAMALSLFSHWVAKRPGLEAWLGHLLLFGNFPLLAALLWLIFRDWVTALVAPLPVFVVLWVVALLSPVRELPLGTLPAVVAGLAVAYFVVDAFLVPRSTPPTLYLYVNDPQSPLFPYEDSQAPTWLRGRSYWVWRFVSATPAEVHKFWERDWERVEVWVRADGDDAGAIEWIVHDFHFRELWIPYERTVSKRTDAEHRHVLAGLRAKPDRAAAWVIEVDVNLVGHVPELRGVFLLPLRQGWRRARWKQLARSLRIQVASDKPSEYRSVVRHLRLRGPDFIDDVPEILRGFALRRLLTIPWRYWRYPRGANAITRPLVYSGEAAPAAAAACEPQLQFKAPPTPAPGDTHSRQAPSAATPSSA
jgi:hypothetical protein